MVVCHSDVDLASGSGVHCRSTHSVVLTGAMTLTDQRGHYDETTSRLKD